ncbi:helix-turn-helix domain-containing protein [Hwanghaeella sp.]|uniref:helix-turn-helix domain-containing protein n=1 Tax=Hwanghaeella sp. TaxID=2605943 RepID=UPI003CCBBA16
MSEANIERLISRRLRDLRKARGVTLDDLASQTGFTKGYLSKIENGKKVPPIETLSRISSALNAEIAYFLRDEEEDEAGSDSVSIVRAHERRPVARGGSAFGYAYESVAHKRGHKSMEPFVFTFPEEFRDDVSFSHGGEEMIFILSGMVDFEVDGKSNILSAGDCAYFDASIRHRGRAIDGEATALVVIYQPDRDRGDA